jgi:hypothetical protein
MPNTYTLLETITVGAAGASSVTFNSIPQTGYTDLVLKLSSRTNSTTNNYTIKFNGSSVAEYTDKIVGGNGSAAFTGSDGPTGAGIYGQLNNGSYTANTFDSSEIYIPNYRSANYKSVSIDGVQETNASSAYSGLVAGLWSNTAAITSITLTPNSSNTYVQYSTFSLYGVSALGVTPTRAPKATGGSIIQTDGTYWYHAFLSSGTFTPATALSCDVLVVAGGGGGVWDDVQYWSAGGGGAGGVLGFASQSFSSAQTITVGAGGAYNSAGSSSQLGSLTAPTGGGSNNIKNGGSGVGVTPRFYSTPGTGISGQGFAGGSVSGPNSGAGGGGAGAVGATITVNNGQGGAGGIGTNSVTNWGALSTVLTTTGLGVSGYIAGGGAGGNSSFYGPASVAQGGTGGGGNGSPGGIGGAGVAGTQNTGSGGGGSGGVGTAGSGSGTPGAGGSGLVIVRYLA